MDTILLYLYIIVNTLICIYYWKKEMGIFQFPFLIGIVSLTFVTPQLINLYENNYFCIENRCWSLFYFSLCNLMLWLGFTLGIRKGEKMESIVYFKNGKGLKIFIWIFAIIGITATIMNRGVYQGGFISGTFVIVSFFASYSAVALLLILIGFNRSLISGKIFILLAVIIIILTIDKILASGRRAATIELVLTILYFFLDYKQNLYKWLKFLVPLFFFAGLIFGSLIGKYRENAYSGTMSLSQNISSLEYDKVDDIQKINEGEIYNAFTGMDNVNTNGYYDYGANNWNGIIRDFVPTALVSKQFKKSLMIENDGQKMVAYLTRSGSTMTGYYDSYFSFGLLGFIKFLIIGFVMGILWANRNTSDIALLFYFTLLTPGLHLLTHSSNYFVSQLVFQIIFVYIALRIICNKTDKQEYEDLSTYESGN